MRAPRFRGLWRVLAAISFATDAAAAHAPPALVSIDHVRVTGRGEHELLVRVQDAGGAPVAGLESDLTVTLDDHGVGETRTQYSGAVGPRTLVVVVDGTMLRGSDAAVVDGVLRAVTRELAPEDRVAVVFAGDRLVVKEWSARELSEGGDRLGALAVAGGPRLFDAVKLAADRAAARRRLSSGALLVVTRGTDSGSRARTGDILAAALGGGVTSLAVVGVAGGQDEAGPALERLAALTGGSWWRVRPDSLLPPSLGPGVRALLDRYRVTFRDAQWTRDGAAHRLEAHVGDSGVGPIGDVTYRSSEVYVSSGWPAAAIWVVLVALIVVAGVVLVSRRPRQVCLLVVQGGEADGQWYEVLDLPVRIGSALESDVVIVLPGVSRSHCLLEREGNAIALVDTNSEFGSFVNGARVTRHILEEDDLIRLGTDVELVYEGR